MTITEKIDRVTSIPVAVREPVAPPPVSCKIELTSRCPYHCAFCSKSIADTSDGDMERKLYSRLIREMHDAGVKELGVFFIGESFTCHWLPESIAEAKSVGFEYVFLTTNGAGATAWKVESCFKAGLDSLKFSLNFADRGQLQSIARVSPSHWDAAIRNLKVSRMIRDAGKYKCGIYASSIKFDGEQGEKMQRLVDDVRPYVDEHYWLPLFSMNEASRKNGMAPTVGNPGRLDNLREPLPCWSVWQAHIDRHGRLIACCFGDTPDNGHVMADLTQVSFLEGWNSEKFQALRAAHLAKDVRGTACETCAAA
jgi:MoaA/NifB/PqqE/SkfB family radical SAM enzyme